jgi:hypothetical protein
MESSPDRPDDEPMSKIDEDTRPYLEMVYARAKNPLSPRLAPIRGLPS